MKTACRFTVLRVAGKSQRDIDWQKNCEVDTFAAETMAGAIYIIAADTH
jgi:hypothetical protein